MADFTSRCRRYRGRSNELTETEIIRDEIRKLKAEAGFKLRCKVRLYNGASTQEVSQDIARYNSEHGIVYTRRQHSHTFACYANDRELKCSIDDRLVDITEILRNLSRELEIV